MKLYYGGHSTFLLDDGKHRLIIDPFMLTPKMRDLKLDYIALTHAHGDHFGDTVELAEANSATVIAVFELANYCSSLGLKTLDGHIGGRLNLDFGSIKFVPAWHGSSIEDGKYMGNPCGFVIKMGGKTIYHAGDTALFGDMKLIGELDAIDYFLCPIGDKYTMGIEDGVRATLMVNPKNVIPIHYNTFGAISQDPIDFKQRLNAQNGDIGVKILKPGDVLEI